MSKKDEMIDDSDLFKRMGKDSKKNHQNIRELLEKLNNEEE